jgi:hypothetical protein
MRSKSTKRRGAVAVLVAVSLIAVLSVVALALDAGLLFDNRRDVQAAADAAALAAADDLFINYAHNKGLDPNGTAKAAALSTAAANGYNNDSVTSVVTVNIPPASGIFAGKAGFAEVIIQYNQPRGFSSIFGSGNLPVRARAVARGNPGIIGILILHPTMQGALEIRGNVNLLSDGQLYSNSNNTTPNDAASQGATGSVFVGSGITLSAGGINVINSLVALGTVNYVDGGGLNYYTVPVPDPLADIPEPTTAGLTNFGSVTITTNTTLQPGIYTNITIGNATSAPTVTMAPGLYYINQGGSFSLNGGTLQGAGVMIVNNTQQDTVFGWTNPAKGVINITPPVINSDGSNSGGVWPTGTSAETYAGMTMWVPRSWNQEVHFQSDHNVTASGTWYAQGAEYDIRANGPSVVFNVGNYICDLGEWNQKIGGNALTGTGTINIDPGGATPTMRPTLVE